MERKLKGATKVSTRKLAVVGMLSSICILLGITGLGFIPIPPVKATIMHIPVIIGAIIEGPVVGAAIGLIFGIFSVIQAITQPTPLSFVFMNPIVSIVPRVIIGLTSYYAYELVKTNKSSIKVGIAAAVGTFTNTFLVLGLMYVIYLKDYAKVLGISIEKAKYGIITVGLTNGIPEILISVAITIPVVAAIKKFNK